MSSTMTDDRLILAIGRLERAITRIEVRADAIKSNNSSTKDLSERHSALQKQASLAIERLDQLINLQGASQNNG